MLILFLKTSDAMFFDNLKLKLVLMALIILLFYFIFKLLNILYLFKAEQEATILLEKKYALVKKNKKLLQENYLNSKYKNEY